MTKKSGGVTSYFGTKYIVTVILAIIPITSWILGAAMAFKRNNILFGVIRLFLGFNIFWIIDLICWLINKKLTILI